jgi:hypothetical protein
METKQNALETLSQKMSKRQQNIFTQISGQSFSPIIDRINAAHRESIKLILDPSISYYPSKELSKIKTEARIPASTNSEAFLESLRNCNPGKDQWNVYQDICKDILSYCLVPLLPEPFEQNENRNGIHRRDLIFLIPHGLGRFWNFIMNKFGLAVIVGCKNYSDFLTENEFIISSKYLDRKVLLLSGC